MNNLPVWLIPVVVAMACPFGSLVIQKTTPWGKMSEKYPVNSEFEGEWLNWRTMSLGNDVTSPRFNGCISLAFSADSLYLKIRPKFLFPFIKPIQIPWSQLRSVKTDKILWNNFYIFKFEDIPELVFRDTKSFREYLSQNRNKNKVLLELIPA